MSLAFRYWGNTGQNEIHFTMLFQITMHNIENLIASRWEIPWSRSNLLCTTSWTLEAKQPEISSATYQKPSQSVQRGSGPGLTLRASQSTLALNLIQGIRSRRLDSFTSGGHLSTETSFICFHLISRSVSYKIIKHILIYSWTWHYFPLYRV